MKIHCFDSSTVSSLCTPGVTTNGQVHGSVIRLQPVSELEMLYRSAFLSMILYAIFLKLFHTQV